MIGGRTAAGRNRGRTGGRSAGDGGGRSGRGVAWCEPEPWAADRRRGGCVLCGRGRWGALMQAQGQCKPPAGRGAAEAATRSRQPGDRTATTAPGRDSAPPAGAEQAANASTNASGQAEDHTKRARALARPREVGTPARSRNARACERYCWAAGQALRVRKRKIFLGKGSKNRFPGAGPGNSWGVKNATNGGE